MNASPLLILTHTPVWVWGVLAGLVGLGWMQSRDRVLPRARLVAMPLVLGVLSLVGAISTFGFKPLVEGAWLAGLVAGIALQFGLKPALSAQALEAGRFAVGGSWQPMVLMVGVFMLRYVVNVTLVIAPQLAAGTAFTATAAGLYGLMSGLFAGRTLRVLSLAPGQCTGGVRGVQQAA